MKIEDEHHAILKRNDESDLLIYVIAFEEYYEKLLEVLIQTGHGSKI